MATETLAQLKAKWINGYTPSGGDYSNIFDSFVHRNDAKHFYEINRLNTVFDPLQPVTSANINVGVVIGNAGAIVFFENHICTYTFDQGTDQWTLNVAKELAGNIGGGDMLKATYDTNNDGIIDRTAKVNGVDAASSSTYYGKNQSGEVGFHALPTGPGGGTSIYNYISGEALIRSSGGASGDVTYSRADNVATVTIPSGVNLMYLRLNLLTSQMGGANFFTVKIIDNNGLANQGDSTTFMPPLTEFIKRDNNSTDPPTSAFPFVYTKDTPPSSQVQITDYGSNEIDVTFKNVDNYAAWTVLIKL